MTARRPLVLPTLALVLAVALAVVGLRSESGVALVVAAGLAAVGLRGLHRNLPALRLPTFGGIFAAVGFRESLLVIAIGASAFAGYVAVSASPSSLTLVAWACGLVCLVGSCFTRFGERSTAEPADHRWTRLDFAIAASLVLVAALVRLHRIDELVPPIHGDEGEMGILSLAALHGADSPAGISVLPVFGTAFLGHPTLFYYVQGAAMLVLGETIIGLRIFGALVGAVGVWAAYAVGRDGWGRAAGGVAGWLLAVSHLHIAFSRMALNNIETVSLGLVVLWLLVRIARDSPSARTRDGWIVLVALGATVGLSQYFYLGARLFVIVVGLLMVVFVWRGVVGWRDALVSLASSLIVFLPLGMHFANRPAEFRARTDGVFAFTEGGIRHTLGPNVNFADDWWRLLLYQVDRVVGFFWRDGDTSAFYLRDLGAFDSVTIVLMWLGFIVVLMFASRLTEQVILTYLGLGLLLAGVVTSDQPNAPRLIVVVPVALVVAGIGVYRICALAPRRTMSTTVVLAMGALLIGGYTLQANLSTFYGRYANVVLGAALGTIATEAQRRASAEQPYLLFAPVFYAENGVFRFVARDTGVRNVNSVEQLAQFEATRTDSRIGVVYILPSRTADIDALKRTYPSAIVTSRADNLGRPQFVRIELPPKR